MKKEFSLSCPVSAARVNENTVRIVAAFVLLLIALSVMIDNYFISIFVLFDFALRSFNLSRYSILRMLALKVEENFQLRKKLTDAAPKKFAALLGFVFSFIIVIAQLLELNTVTIITASVLVFCAFLESAIGICLGCYVYSFIKTVSIKK